MNIRRLTIKTRLNALVAGGLVLMALTSLGSFAGLRLVAENNQKLVDGHVALMATLGRIGGQMADLRRYEKDVLLNLEQSDAVAGYVGKWNDAHGKLAADVARLGEMVKSDEARGMLKEFTAAEAGYVGAAKEVLEKAKAGALDSAKVGNAALKPAKESIYKAEAILAAGSKKIEQGLAAAKDELAAFSATLQAVMLGALAFALVGGTLLGWLVVRSILQPLASGVGFAKRVAEGDLGAQPDVSGRDEVTTLMKALQGMAADLGSVVRQVREASENIQVASAEVATGNADLSQRTEHTASQLQQTSSSMSQLTATVRQSADAAQQANQLAASAAEVAERGGTVVTEVVTTMDRIHTSSRRIADIIGTIDGIAFQTNILALNAAVEAARAGEQGRGFAVVAGEVRSLAQRSAEAAREIKSLIGASVENVENGSKLVADAGQTMNEIVASVQRVSDIIGEISAAAGEQSSGIAQVNTAVVQLDQLTQQNAALVEQSAAAAESLKDQAVKLAGTVTRFQLDRAGARAMPIETPKAQAPAPAPMKAAASPKAVAQQTIQRAAAKPAAPPAARPAAKPMPTSTTAAAAPAASAASATPAKPAADDDWETF